MGHGRMERASHGATGFFDVERRLEAISAKGDPLETIKKIVRWEDFRADIESVTATKPEERKSNAGRKPYDAILKFKIVVLQSLHNLSDEQTEYLIRDRLSFMHFLDLNLEDPVPDATTIWLFREALAQAGLIDNLFERFGQHLEAEGYIARLGEKNFSRCPLLLRARQLVIAGASAALEAHCCAGRFRQESGCAAGSEGES